MIKLKKENSNVMRLTVPKPLKNPMNLHERMLEVAERRLHNLLTKGADKQSIEHAEKTVESIKRICEVDRKLSKQDEGIVFWYGDLRLKPPFAAGNEVINCPLPAIERLNPVRVDAYCHGWALQDELCHFAGTCSAYLAILQARMKEGKSVDLKVFEKLGVRIDMGVRRWQSQK